MLKILEFLNKLNNLADELNEVVKNSPVSDADRNPFSGAFSQTFVWVDEEDKS